LDKKFKDVTSELQDLKMQNKNLDEQRDHYKQIAELSTDTLNELSKQYESVVKEKSIIERERNTILEDLNKQIVNYKVISEQLRLERIKANENIITINDLKNKVKSLEFSTKEFDTNFEDKFRNDLKIREKKLIDTNNIYEQQVRETAEAFDQLNKTKDDITKLESELTDLHNSLTREQNKVNNLEETIKTTEKSHSQKKRKRNMFKNQTLPTWPRQKNRTSTNSPRNY